MTDEEIVKHYINKNDLIKDDCKDEFYKKIKEHSEKNNISLYESASYAFISIIVSALENEAMK